MVQGGTPGPCQTTALAEKASSHPPGEQRSTWNSKQKGPGHFQALRGNRAFKITTKPGRKGFPGMRQFQSFLDTTASRQHTAPISAPGMGPPQPESLRCGPRHRSTLKYGNTNPEPAGCSVTPHINSWKVTTPYPTGSSVLCVLEPEQG